MSDVAWRSLVRLIGRQRPVRVGASHQAYKSDFAKKAASDRQVLARNMIALAAEQDVAAARQKELVASRAWFDRAKKASTRLVEDANDAAAKTVLGEYFCGVAGAWERGLPLLSAGDNAALQELAVKDLANPAE